MEKLDSQSGIPISYISPNIEIMRHETPFALGLVMPDSALWSLITTLHPIVQAQQKRFSCAAVESI